jgi:hypothetical protein
MKSRKENTIIIGNIGCSRTFPRFSGKLVIAVVFAMIFSLIFAPGAKADGWQLQSSSLSGSVTNKNGTYAISTGTVLANASAPLSPYYTWGGSAVTLSSGGTSGGYGGGSISGSTIPSTTPFHFYSEVHASWQAYETVNSVALNNGLGDPFSANGFYDTSMQFHDQDDIDDEAGSHIVMEQTGSGTVTYTVSFSGSISTASSVVSGVSGHVAISPDTRYAQISIPVTYKKSGGSRIANTADADGTQHATVGTTYEAYYPNPPTSPLLVQQYIANFTYAGLDAGDWADASSYHWYDSQSDSSASGVFGPEAIDNFAVSYVIPIDTTFPVTTHVNLKLTDSANGADATANCYVEFHQELDNILVDSSQTVVHPLPIGTNISDWQFLGYVDNDSAGSISKTLGYKFSETNTATLQSGGSLDAGEIEEFSVQNIISVGTTYEWSDSQTYSPPTYTRIAAYLGVTYYELHGTADLYGSDGYDSSTTWEGNKYTGTDSVGTITVGTYDPVSGDYTSK